MSITWLMLVPIAAVVLVVGLLGLKLIAVVFNGIFGNRRPDHMAQQDSSFGTFSGLLAGAAILAVVIGVGFLRYARTGMVVRSQHSQAEQQRADAAASLREAMHDLSAAREDMQEAVQDAAGAVTVKLDDVRTPDGTHGSNGIDVSQTAAVSEPDTSISDNPISTAESPDVQTSVEVVVPSTTVAEQPAVDPEMMARREQLAQLATTIGQLVRSRLDQNGEKTLVDPAGQAAKAAGSDVVVFQLSEDVVQQLLGESGRQLLQSFNSELPDRIRQTYALIPLTPPVGSAVSPVKSLLAAGGLESLANSLVSLVDVAEPRTESQPGGALPVVLATAPETRPMPDWVKKPDGRRIVAETEPFVTGEDATRPLTGAINRALADHLESVTKSIEPALREQSRFVKLELSETAAQLCVVETFERFEVLDTAAEGPKSMTKLYALLEFPEAVDYAAIQELRRSVQRDRIAGLGFILGCAWLSIASAGFGIRLWRKGTRLRRWSSVPVFVAISVPLLAMAVGSIFALRQGEAVRPPWNQTPDVVRIELPDAV